MSIATELVDKFNSEMAQLRVTRSWVSSPPVKKILDSLQYLAEKYSATAVVYPSASGAYVYLAVRDLNGLKDESLASLLWSMENHNPGYTKTEDHPMSFARSYAYYFYIDNKPLVVTIRAEFKEDSETCKRVIVGYNKPSSEPTPIYELKCSDEDTAATEQPA